jgi:hypothetical protein
VSFGAVQSKTVDDDVVDDAASSVGAFRLSVVAVTGVVASDFPALSLISL